MGEEFMREMFKPYGLAPDVRVHRTPQHVQFIQQPIKAGITGGAPAKKLVLQFMEQHEFREARRRSQTRFGVPDCGTVWLRPFPRTLLIGVSGAQYGAAVALQGSACERDASSRCVRSCAPVVPVGTGRSLTG